MYLRQGWSKYWYWAKLNINTIYWARSSISIYWANIFLNTIYWEILKHIEKTQYLKSFLNISIFFNISIYCNILSLYWVLVRFSGEHILNILWNLLLTELVLSPWIVCLCIFPPFSCILRCNRNDWLSLYHGCVRTFHGASPAHLLGARDRRGKTQYIEF